MVHVAIAAMKYFPFEPCLSIVTHSGSCHLSMGDSTLFGAAVNNMDAVTDCLAKPKAVIAENLLSDMAALDGSNALQASFRQPWRLFDSNKNIVV